MKPVKARIVAKELFLWLSIGFGIPVFVRSSAVKAFEYGTEIRWIRKAAGSDDWAWVSGTVPAGTKLDMDSELLNTCNPEDVEIESRMTWNTSFLCVDHFEDIGNGQMAAMLQMPYGAVGQSLGSNCSYSPSKQQTLYNVFEWLDEPGEFYFDKAAKRLYYYPREGEDMAEAETVIPELETLVRLQGEDLENRAENISFSGLTFEHSDWNMYRLGDSYGRVCVQGDIAATAAVFDNFHDSIYRGFDTTPGAVEFSSARNIVFANNTIRNTGNAGLTLVNDVTEFTMDGNVISDTGGSNLVIGHPQHMYIGDKNSGKGNFSEYEKYDPDTEGSCSVITLTNNYFYNSCELFWGGSSINGIVTAYEIETSENGSDWTTAAEGTWSYDTLAPDTEERFASFDTVWTYIGVILLILIMRSPNILSLSEHLKIF